MKKIIIGIIIAVVVVTGLVAVTESQTKKVESFKQYLLSKEGEFSQYIIGSDDKEYASLIKQSKQAIEYRNVKAMPEIESKMNALVAKAEKEDEAKLTKQLDDIKSINLKRIDEAKRKEIESKIKESEELIKNKQYRDASKIITPLAKEIYTYISSN
ncbi:hypothetical protein [Clostridium sp.]|uniref:hypothetical protein n=1 Tax=Clostridium sp. TaxID=1506 RepID=UPI002FCC721B